MLNYHLFQKLKQIRRDKFNHLIKKKKKGLALKSKVKMAIGKSFRLWIGDINRNNPIEWIDHQRIVSTWPVCMWAGQPCSLRYFSFNFFLVLFRLHDARLDGWPFNLESFVWLFKLWSSPSRCCFPIAQVLI
jgi:hypothetical protein